MDRRDLLKGGLLAAFLPAGWVKAVTDIEVRNGIAKAPAYNIAGKRYYSPYFKKLGSAQNIVLSINYNLNWMSELGSLHHRFITFPIEAIIEIAYERGDETWSGFNPNNHALKKFSIDRFFHAKFVEGQLAYGGSIELDGVQYKLASVSTTDTNKG